ncbi:MAG: sulfurtransferase [Proteobacteria bacterium]|nr:sulfurtransferase [Pseudomonadota bacterium]
MRQLSAQQAATLLAQGQARLLDVREDWEYELAHVDGALHVPMGEIPARYAELPADEPLIVICHHGMRSLQVAQFLAARGFADVANLDGGIDAWAATVDPALARY